MAQRRMFSKEVTNSSEFQMMSPSAQALYFHIGMNADDDGFCEAFTIVRMTESKPDDLRALQERSFIYLVDSKVCIVKDWHTNNDIRIDRYAKSKYLSDSKYSDVYMAIMEDKIKHLTRYSDMSVGITSGSTNGSTQVRLGKVRLGKKNTNGDFIAFWEAYPRKVAKPKAESAYEKALKKATIEEINAGLERWKSSKEWEKENGQFIPHASTWLNQERWNDAPQPRKTTAYDDFTH